MLNQLPPEIPKKRPGVGFFAIVGLLAVIVLAIVWAFSMH